MEQSDHGIHCMPFRLHLLDTLLYGKATLFTVITANVLGVWIFQIFYNKSVPLQFYQAQGRVYTRYQTTWKQSPGSFSWNHTVGIFAWSPLAGTQLLLEGYQVLLDPGRQTHYGTGSLQPQMSEMKCSIINAQTQNWEQKRTENENLVKYLTYTT